MTTEALETTVIPEYSYAREVVALVASEPAPEDVAGDHLLAEISALEQVVRAAEALLAEKSAQLVDERSAFMPGRQAYLSAAGESGLARGLSRDAACTTIDIGLALRRMPTVLAGWRHGLISRATAAAIVRALPPLDDEEMALLEVQLEPLLPGLTPHRAAEIVRALIIEIDPDAADAKAEQARQERFVLARDENDATATIIAAGPAEQVRAIETTLDRAASSLIADGDRRTRGQIMFDLLHHAVLNGTELDGLAIGHTVEIGIVMTADTLLGHSDEPAVLDGHGPIAPAVVDQIVNNADRVFYRRLITDPVDRTLVGIDTQRRLFTGPLARFVRARDRNRCRAPFCDSRARHTDHIVDHQHGGATTAANAQRVCVLDHVIKHLPGWHARALDHGDIEWTTPTGRTYLSPAPPALW